MYIRHRHIRQSTVRGLKRENIRHATNMPPTGYSADAAPGDSESGQPEQTMPIRSVVSNEIAKKNNDAHLVFFVLNAVLLWFLAITVLMNGADNKLFTFDWTRRLRSSDEAWNMTRARDDIMLAYKLNSNSSLFGLGTMMDEVLRNASCRPVYYDGGLSWSSREVSPTCGCLRNIHVEYIKAVRPNGTGLTVQNFKDNSTIEGVANITHAIHDRCFKFVRPTQVRDGADDLFFIFFVVLQCVVFTRPDTPFFFWRAQIEDVSDSGWKTNVVCNTVYWNVVSCFTALFLMFFEAKKQSAASPANPFDQGTLTDCMFGGPSMLKVGLGIIFALLTYASLFAAVPWVGDAFIIGPQAAFAAIFFAICLVMWVMERGSNPYDSRKNIVYWIAYIMVVPCVVNALHMLLQRRDQILNWVSVFAVVAGGFCALGVEFMQAAFSDTNSYHQDDGGFSAEKLRSHEEKKNRMIKIVMLSILVKVVMLTSATFPWFPSGSFSNAYYAVSLVAALLCVPVLVFPGRYLSRLQVVSNKFVVWNLWTQGLVAVEVLARFIFTVAVLSDMWGIRMHDFGSARGYK